MKKRTLFIILSFVFTLSIFSEDLDQLLKLANEGNSEAQYNIGVLYYLGEEVSKDNNKAYEWFEKSALQGNPMAQMFLGIVYFNGEGVPKDNKKAFEWFEKSAVQGFSDAQYNLGVMYHNGEGVPKNDIEARKWFKAATDNGYNVDHKILEKYKLENNIKLNVLNNIFG